MEIFNVIISILKESGWTTERNINIDSILSYFKNKGYLTTSAQQDFLRNFSNLEIVINGIGKYNIKTVQLFPCEYDVPKSFLKKYENYTKKRLIPIGGIECENLFLMMDSDLQIYGVFENYITFLGNNIFKVFEDLYENKKITLTHISI